jgi:hypothetical protein
VKGTRLINKVYKTERGFMERLHRDDLGFSWTTIWDAVMAVRRDGTAGMRKGTEAIVVLRPNGYLLTTFPQEQVIYAEPEQAEHMAESDNLVCLPMRDTSGVDWYTS